MWIDIGILLIGLMLGFIGAKLWILGMRIMTQRKKSAHYPHIKLCD